MKNWRTEQLKKLMSAILSLKTETEALAFFRDLCTLEELKEMAGRWGVVKLLDQGESYREIAQATGVSTATITRIADWLNHGEGGYKLILQRSERKK